MTAIVWMRAMIHLTRTALQMKVRKRKIIMIILISVLAFFCVCVIIISENRTRSAAFREVNQAARRATALSFYVPISLYISPISISFIRLISSFFNHSTSMWLIHLRALFACRSLCEKVLFEFHEFALAWLSDFSQWDSSSQEYQTMQTSNTIFPYVYAMCVLTCVCVGNGDSAWVLRVGVAHSCTKVVSMVIDVGSSPWRWIGWGCWPPRSWTKDKTRVIAATQTGNRRGALQEEGAGGSRKKVQFHKPNYFWDGGEKNITAIAAPGMRGEKEREVVAKQEAAGRRREVPNKSSIIKVIKHVRSHKQTEWHPITWTPHKLSLRGIFRGICQSLAVIFHVVYQAWFISETDAGCD